MSYLGMGTTEHRTNRGAGPGKKGKKYYAPLVKKSPKQKARGDHRTPPGKAVSAAAHARNIQARSLRHPQGKAVSFTPGRRGQILPASRRGVTANPIVPGDPSHHEAVALTSYPATFTQAGAMTGNVPATSQPISVDPAQYSGAFTPAGPTLTSAVAARDAAADAAAEANIREADMDVPEEKKGVDTKTLLLIGGGVVAVWYLWLR